MVLGPPEALEQGPLEVPDEALGPNEASVRGPLEASIQGPGLVV